MFNAPDSMSVCVHKKRDKATNDKQIVASYQHTHTQKETTRSMFDQRENRKIQYLAVCPLVLSLGSEGRKYGGSFWSKSNYYENFVSIIGASINEYSNFSFCVAVYLSNQNYIQLLK